MAEREGRSGRGVSGGAELIRAESNFEEWGIGLPSNRGGPREDTRERKIEAEVGGSRVLMRQSWTMRAGGNYSLPGEFDQDVYYALLCLVQRKGGMPEDGVLAFTLYELLGVLGRRRRSGQDYRQVAESLDRLSATSYRSRSAFYSAARKRRITDTFWLFGVTLRENLPAGEEGEAVASAQSVVRFSPEIVASYKAGYLTALDPETYFALPSAVSRRLYRVIEHGRGASREFEVGLEDLRVRIPLSARTHRYASQIRRPLDAAHEVLVSARFLEEALYLGNGRDQRVRYRVEEGHASRRSAREGAHEPLSSEEIVARERLVSEGVEPRVADRLLRDHGPDVVIAAADKLAATPAGKVANPAGWLVRAVERGYAKASPSGA